MAVFDQNVHQRVVTPSELIEELNSAVHRVQLDQSNQRSNGRRATTALDLEHPGKGRRWRGVAGRDDGWALAMQSRQPWTAW